MTGIKQLIERLRESDNDTEYVSPIGNERRPTLAWEAADCIERLTQPVGVEMGAIDDALHAFGTAGVYNNWQKQIEAANTIKGAVARLQTALAEANKTAAFNFEQYQDCGRLLNEECEKSEKLQAERDELVKQLKLHQYFLGQIVDSVGIDPETTNIKISAKGAHVATLNLEKVFEDGIAALAKIEGRG